DKMPEDETITSFGDRLIALARLNLKQHGGGLTKVGGKQIYRIPIEKSVNVEKLPDAAKESETLRSQYAAEIERAITAGRSEQEKPRGPYLAICLDLASTLKQKYPDQWLQAVAALYTFPRVLQAIFYEAPIPAGEALAAKAAAAEVQKPAQR